MQVEVLGADNMLDSSTFDTRANHSSFLTKSQSEVVTMLSTVVVHDSIAFDSQVKILITVINYKIHWNDNVYTT